MYSAISRWDTARRFPAYRYMQMIEMNALSTSSIRRRLISSALWGGLLIWPTFLLLVYLGFFWHSPLLAKGPNEIAAPIILGTAGALFLARWCRERRELLLLLTVLTAALFCRELHFAGTSKGIYVALFLIGIWTLTWWRRIEEILRQNRTTSVLIFAMATYVLSQAVARRTFRGILPFEADSDVFRTGLEETLENLAHLSMLLVAALGFSRSRPQGDGKEDSDPAQSV